MDNHTLSNMAFVAMAMVSIVICYTVGPHDNRTLSGELYRKL